MTAANMGAVMDQIGVALSTITGLRVFDFPPLDASPPFAFVDTPDQIAYDFAYRDAEDRYTVNVIVGVTMRVDRAYRDAISEYAAHTGSKSIKAAIEAGTIGNSCRVQSVSFGAIALASKVYFGATFVLDIAA